MLRSDVDQYFRDTAAVEGWLFPIDAYLIAWIDEVQQRGAVKGNLFEIGVHHGKSAILLARAAQHDEILGVCDVFEDQAANIDRSGEGSHALFLRNLRSLSRLPAQQLRVFAKRSSLLTSADTTSACRIIHIDGGHRPEDVVADLGVACSAILRSGVVILDDVFNPSWPGVSEGLYQYMALRPDALAPFLIGGNKVFLTLPPSVGLYADEIAQPEIWRNAVGDAPFVHETKSWLGRSVSIAGRTAWVDLDPIQAAREHISRLRWRDKWRILRGKKS